MTTQQPNALRLANVCGNLTRYSMDAHLIAAELRRQHARIADLEAQLEAIGAGWVSGPLIGQPQAMPDMTALTERGARAWAGVDAQALREGGASLSANAAAPSAHIKEPYTLAEIKAKIASNDYSAEMLLQHAMLLLDSVQEDVVRMNWLDTDGGMCVFHIGKTWYTRPSYGLPHRKRTNLRAAIDAAMADAARAAQKEGS